jgi:thiol-disulfide isomerase/thioredoxin
MAEALKKTLFICRRAAFLLLLLFLVSPGSRFDASAAENDKVILYYFWGTGCPVCEEAKPFLSGLAQRHPQLEIRSYDVIASRENLALWIETAERFGTRPAGVPSFYVGEQAFSGFSPEIAREIEATVSDRATETVPEGKTFLQVPLFGSVEPEGLSINL